MQSKELKTQSEAGKSASALDGDAFLGEILSGVTGKNLRYARRKTEERVSLIPDTANLSDPFAILVRDGNNKSIGRLSHSTAKWLSPLLKAGTVRAEARIPARSGFAESLKSSSMPLRISLFRASPTENFWEIAEIESQKDVLHQLVCQAFRIAKGYSNPTHVEYLTEGLRSLAKKDLHPQTHFLLALLEEMGRKRDFNSRRIAGMTFVRRDGVPASRLRVFWRALVAWIPILSLLAPLAAMQKSPPSASAVVVELLLVALVGGLAVLSAALPNRGLPDRLAGTWPVPR